MTSSVPHLQEFERQAAVRGAAEDREVQAKLEVAKKRMAALQLELGVKAAEVKRNSTKQSQ